jgi:acetyl esterase/lipase
MRTLLLVTLLLAAALAPAQVKEYAYGADPLQKLDLVLPKDPHFTTVIFVHGGSLTDGDKRDSDYGHVCDPFPATGIACANVNYRLAPKDAWPAAAEDVAAAVAWVRDHIAAHGGDPKQLFLLGHSSGAMLVALVGSDERYLAKHRMKPGNLRGVMPMGSIMWDDELDQLIAEHGHDAVAAKFLNDPDNRMFGSLDVYEDHWPIRHVHAGLPPFLFLIASAETEYPPVLKTDMKFEEDSRKAGNQATDQVFGSRTHYSMIHRLDEPEDEVFAAILDFIDTHTDDPR